MGFGKDKAGVIIYDAVEVDIGALNAQDASNLASRNGGNMVEDFRMLRMDYWMAIKPAQAVVVLDGPIIVGVSHGDLTGAEVEEALESIVLGNDNIVANEQAMRPVWPLEVFIIPDADSADNATLVRKGTFKPRWTFPNPAGWRWWVYNNSDAQLVTGTNLNILAKCFGVWLV